MTGEFGGWLLDTLGLYLAFHKEPKYIDCNALFTTYALEVHDSVSKWDLFTSNGQIDSSLVHQTVSFVSLSRIGEGHKAHGTCTGAFSA